MRREMKNQVSEYLIPTMLPIREAAQQTGLSYDYIRKLCLRRKIVYIRCGAKYLVNFNKLLDYLNTGDAAEQEGTDHEKF